ncbi:hypothetical protein BC829DRAFT_443490 [Chytridium lagenaria]|nr:hypothetical protein BC829DRAFT_443490 [Chytridium lagenaria]
MVEDTASRPLAVLQRCVGTTAPNGELSFRAIVPKLWSLKDRRNILIELQLDDGTEPTSRVTLVECVLMQRLRHAKPLSMAASPNFSIPATIHGSVGHSMRTKPPMLAPGSPTIFMNLKSPFQPCKPTPNWIRSSLNMFPSHGASLKTHTTTIVSSLQSQPRSLGSLVLKILNAVPLSPSPIPRAVVNVVKKDKIQDLADIMSSVSPPLPLNRLPLCRCRRKSASSQGSAGSGGRFQSNNMSSITSGMNDLMLAAAAVAAPISLTRAASVPVVASRWHLAPTHRTNGDPLLFATPTPPQVPITALAHNPSHVASQPNLKFIPTLNGNNYPITPSSNPSPTAFYPNQGTGGSSPSLRNLPQPSQSPTPGLQSYQQQQQIPHQQSYSQQQQPPQQSYQDQQQQHSNKPLLPHLLGSLPPPPSQPLPPVPETLTSASLEASPSTTSGSHVFRVQYAFTPTLDDEILLEVGDLIEVLEVFDDGWARGRTVKSDGAGYFPVRCLTLPTVTATPEKSEKAKLFDEMHAGKSETGEGLPKYS